MGAGHGAHVTLTFAPVASENGQLLVAVQGGKESLIGDVGGLEPLGQVLGHGAADGVVDEVSVDGDVHGAHGHRQVVGGRQELEPPSSSPASSRPRQPAVGQLWAWASNRFNV